MPNPKVSLEIVLDPKFYETVIFIWKKEDNGEIIGYRTHSFYSMQYHNVIKDIKFLGYLAWPSFATGNLALIRQLKTGNFSEYD